LGRRRLSNSFNFLNESDESMPSGFLTAEISDVREVVTRERSFIKSWTAESI
jgi:hypothetical protein